MAAPRRALEPDDQDASDRESLADRGNGPRRAIAPPRTRRRVMTTVALTLAVVLVACGAVVAVAILRLQDNINAVDVTDQLGTDRPTVAKPSGPGAFPGPLTIAVFGDDTRSGDNDFIGGAEGVGRSDTTLVVHLNADRTQIQVVSIPRDSMVQRPTCEGPDGSEIPPEFGMFNAAYTVGGPACSIRTIESLTDVRIDEYVVVDFNGFTNIVDAVGGVEVCVPEAINDPDSKLDIPAGTTTLNGEQALAFVRTRHAIGDGSDLARIGMQQLFLKSLANKIRSMDLVGDAPRLYSFLDAATQSLTTSPKLAKITNLVELAQDLQDIDSDQIIFETVPVGAYAPDPNRVQWTSEAEEIWEAMRNDEPFPGTEPPESSKPTKTKKPSQTKKPSAPKTSQPTTSQPKTTKPEQPPASSSSAPICAA